MVESWSGQERRTAARFTARGALVSYQKLDLLSRLFGGKKTAGPFPVRNISSSGVCFSCQENLRPRQRLLMTIRLTDRGPNVTVVTSVVWTGEGRGAFKHQSGVRYVDFKGDSWRTLSHLEEHIVKKEEASSGYRLRRGRAAAREEAPAGPESGKDS